MSALGSQRLCYERNRKKHEGNGYDPRVKNRGRRRRVEQRSRCCARQNPRRGCNILHSNVSFSTSTREPEGRHERICGEHQVRKELSSRCWLGLAPAPLRSVRET